MKPILTRRRLLGAGGTAAALSVAGCNEFANDGGVEGSDPAGSEGDHEVTVVANVDQTEIQAAQEEAQAARQEAQEDLEAGEIDEEEAQRIVEEAREAVEETQRELLTEAVSAIEAHVGDVAGLSVSDSNAEFGVALIEGDGGSIVELLTLDDVQAIVDGAEYDTI